MNRNAVRRRTIPGLLATLLVGVIAAAAPATAAPPGPAAPAVEVPRPTDPIAHDPVMVTEGDWYYVAITGDAGPDDTYIPMKRSRDLVHWEELGPAFTQLPDWVLEALGVTAENAPRDAWAPDLFWTGSEWRLYYSASQFGTNNSVIGLMTSPTLADAEWVDQGVVVRSHPAQPDPDDPDAPPIEPASPYNAIDPNVVVDADGKQWMTFGSFFGGLYLVALDPATGKVAEGAEYIRIAHRETPPHAQENPAIVYRDGLYYLFQAYDFCCRGVESDYRTVVGRSESIAGPYVDAEGLALLDGKGGTEVLRGYNEFAGPGGADVMFDGETWYLVNHYYDATDDGLPRLNVREVTWTDEGWPVVSEPVNRSRSVGRGEAFVQIAPRGSTAVVENAGCGYEGANIALWEDLDNLCQQWQVEDRGEGARVVNRFSNKVAEVAGCPDGSNVAQWGWVGFLENNDCQRWTFADAGDGWTSVVSVLPGERAWTVEGAAVAGANIGNASSTGAAGQQFRFEPVGEVLLADPMSAMQTLGVDGCWAGLGNGSQVRFQHRNGSGCQTWVFDAVPGAATYTVASPDSGKVIASSGCLDSSSATALRLVAAEGADEECIAWTLAPADDGTWVLANAGTSLSVQLLRPEAGVASRPGPWFTDVPANHEFVEPITWLAQQGITTGYPDGTFRPTAEITRQAMAAYIYRMVNGGAEAPACTSRPFPDVMVDSEFCGEIAWLEAEGLAEGYADGTYRPAASISRQAIAAFTYRLVNDGMDAPACTVQPWPDVVLDNQFCGEIAWLRAEGLSAGYEDGTFRPTSPTSRQAMAAFLYRLAMA